MEHFSEAEAQRIFAEAARASAPPPESGLSLDELREIGRAAGLDPDAVTAAAVAVRDAAAPHAPMWGTTPLTTRRTRIATGRLSDAAWTDVVAGLQHEFGARGVTATVGQARTWTYAVGSGAGVIMARLTAESVSETTRLTLESGDWGEKRAATLLAGIVLGLGALAAGVAGFDLGMSEMLVGVLVALAIVAAIFGGLRWVAARRARIERDRFDAVLDRIAPITARHPAPGERGRDPLLDLPGDETVGTASTTPLRRTRA